MAEVIPELRKDNRTIIKALRINQKEWLEMEIFCTKNRTSISNVARVAIKNYMKQHNSRK